MLSLLRQQDELQHISRRKEMNVSMSLKFQKYIQNFSYQGKCSFQRTAMDFKILPFGLVFLETRLTPFFVRTSSHLSGKYATNRPHCLIIDTAPSGTRLSLHLMRYFSIISKNKISIYFIWFCVL